MHHIVPGRK